MNLYLVARWGNDEEGPDGKDTLFLVAAKSHLDAVRLTEKELKQLPHQNVSTQANWICLLGVVSLDASYKGVLKGPYYDFSAIKGCTTLWTRQHWQKKWHRE